MLLVDQMPERLPAKAPVLQRLQAVGLVEAQARLGMLAMLQSLAMEQAPNVLGVKCREVRLLRVLQTAKVIQTKLGNRSPGSDQSHLEEVARLTVLLPMMVPADLSLQKAAAHRMEAVARNPKQEPEPCPRRMLEAEQGLTSALLHQTGMQRQVQKELGRALAHLQEPPEAVQMLVQMVGPKVLAKFAMEMEKVQWRQQVTICPSKVVQMPAQLPMELETKWVKR